MSKQKRFREFAVRAVPRSVLVGAWAAYSRQKARSAESAFARAGTRPEFLGWDELAMLQNRYPLEPRNYSYDQQSLEETGRHRINAMLSPLGKEAASLQRFLDLGAWDGTTCYLLQEMGKTAVGIDIRTEGLTPAAQAANIPFGQMDAAELAFIADSFDYVFSYNSFEHFPDPVKTLSEAWRVVRPGGYIYLNFGPIYYSPKGAHQYRTISVPYCECLFSKQLLTDFAAANNIELTEFHWMNEWTVARFRHLWQSFDGRLEQIRYHEIYNADHVDLIEQYPSCFRSKTADFDDLIVSNFEILFRKR